MRTPLLALALLACRNDDTDPKSTVDLPPAEALSVQVDADQSEGLSPLAVQFDCRADDGVSPVTYAWSFGDGSGSQAPDPGYVYESGGTWVATCVATDAVGAVGTGRVEIDVEADALPEAHIQGGPLGGLAPMEVALSATASGGNGNLQAMWDFGDGDQANGMDVTHTYDTAGTYLVELVVRDAQGDTAVDSAEIAVGTDSVPAVAIRADDREGISPWSADLEAVVGGGNPPLTYQWDLGDGATTAGPLAPHTWTALTDTDFTATVVVTDSDGDQATASVQLHVYADTSPQGDVVVDVTGTPASAPALIALSCGPLGSSEFAGNPPFDVQWDFGDGQYGVGRDATHRYDLPGSYDATCTVIDANGDAGSASATLDIAADSAPQLAEITATPPSGVLPLTVSFDRLVLGGSPPFTYTWRLAPGVEVSADTGNNVTVQGVDYPAETPVFTYDAPGTYTVALTVEDADGDLSAATTTVQVMPDSTPTIDVIATPSGGIAPLTVTLQAISTGDGPFTWDWEFSDATTATGQQVTRTFTTTADHYVTVTDADGDSQLLIFQIPVEPDSSPADDGVIADAVQADTLAPSVVYFDCSATSGNPPLTYAWDFGDGTTASTARPSHSYTRAGSFAAQCTVTDANGDVDTATTIVQVVEDTAPVITLAADPLTSGIAPVELSFSANVVGGNGALYYAWSWGDGSPQEEGPAGSLTFDGRPIENPTHTFVSGGTYAVSLWVTDADATAPDIDVATLMVEVQRDLLPSAGITASDTSILVGDKVSFTGAFTGNLPLTVAWDFDDGSTADGVTSVEHFFLAAGVHRVEATVVDADLDIVTTSVDITVENNTSPSDTGVEATFTQPDPVAPSPVQLGCTGAGGTAFSGNPPFLVTWDLGDGATATGTNVSHTYTDGTFLARCTVTDADGDSADGFVSITVVPDTAPVIAGLTAPKGLAGEQLAIDSVVSGGTGLLHYVWTYDGVIQEGDAGSGIETAYFLFTEAGLHAVTLTVIDEDGDADTSTLTVEVLPRPPIAHAGPDQCVAGFGIVALDGSASTDPDGGDALDYHWRFVQMPAGSASVLNDPQLQSPSFIPDRFGVYVLRLEVRTADATHTDEVTIERRGLNSLQAVSPAGLVVATANSDLPEPFVVLLQADCTTAQAGPTPLAGASVDWSSTGGVTPDDPASDTDANGHATVTATAGSTTGPAVLTASYGTNSVHFQIDVQ